MWDPRDFQILLRPNTFFSPITDIRSLIRPPKKGAALKPKAGNAIKTRMEFVISDFEFAKKQISRKLILPYLTMSKH